jgi:hypothetical protein
MPMKGGDLGPLMPLLEPHRRFDRPKVSLAAGLHTLSLRYGLWFTTTVPDSRTVLPSFLAPRL